MIDVGETEHSLHYEVEAMNRYVLMQEENSTLSLSIDVLELMDSVRNQWGLTYDFEL